MANIAHAQVDRTRQLARTPERARDGLSRTGKRVTLTLTANGYLGARPFYVLRYQGRPQRTRYPVSRERAEALFAAYCQDVTDSQAVKDWLQTAPGVLGAS